ncbi:aluminum-activated malate transporter 2-like [Olea europaea var. sylvestris]|uniref:Aluminum-activated malate transporter 2-like n=1 Tax=Olea europaea subsp. europaea TaxID=158383 RepID=A0A8S0SKT0_OLEEU|nr:aluminum-activated malate transporter 2-like [Olea europaea var. sylvestris]CAA2992190.1 aluminum-activated malate transporter 2-like [Olea europaea subsp. europaea]
MMEKFVAKITVAASEGKKLGVEDPRRIIHSLKVGLAITLVSLFYYFDTLYQGFGVSAMWAVITVVVVFEFSVGATLGRGVNRAIATLLAGSLGVGAHRLANILGEKLEPVFLGFSVFLVVSSVTFIRFHPKLKARFDYGLLIFILTFCLISVSGYRDDEVLKMAHKRLSTILIGGSAAVVVCSFICPIWAGEDLHNLIAGNIENLGIFLEGFGHEYFQTSDGKLLDDKASVDEYKSVLNSKGTEEYLANFAKWEPRHGRFRYRHPWDQYLKIGVLVRECAYRIDALNGYLNSEMKTPAEVRDKIQESCTKMSSESSLALKELALSIKTMSSSSIADPHIVNAKTAAKKLKLLLKSDMREGTDFLEIIPAASVSSLLIEIVSSTVKIADSVHELASMAKFKNDVLKQKETEKGKVLRVPSIERSHNISIIAE